MLRKKKQLKIFVTGTRGIPNIPGGVEKHCQDLYPLIAQQGYQVIFAVRKSYVKKKISFWKNIQLEPLYSPPYKSFEAIVHTFFAVLKAWQHHADIVHIHAVGPGLLVPFAKLLGLKVVVTNHGPDYHRQKWNKVAKIVLQLGEFLGAKFADEVIVISQTIKDIIAARYKREAHMIYNGVTMPIITKDSDFLKNLNITPGNYLVAVARFVPEKGLDLLVKAFQKINKEIKLVIAGDADHETDYSRHLKKMIDQDKRIVRTGYITGEPLNQLFSHARLFILPSYHEGLPIALLEAMSYGLHVLVSNIDAHLELNLPTKSLFKCGDTEDLKIKIENLLFETVSNDERTEFQQLIKQKYNWQTIAQQTIAVYKKTMIDR